jgi:uncharacterized protein YecT (DUF1311 family)
VLAVLVGGLVVALAVSYALARSTDPTASATNASSCENAKSNSALKECVFAAWQRERKLMDKTAVRAETDFPKALVTKAQASFQLYANAECAVAPSLNAGGSEYPLLVSRCEIKLTAGRIQQLESDITYARQAGR